MFKFLLNLKTLSVAIAAAILGVFVISSCSQDEGMEMQSASVQSSAIDTLPEVISANRTLSADTIYRLNGKVYVTNGATLTISAGTTIQGLPASSTINATALIITRGSKIYAVGTAGNPIVMTAYNGTKGGWGGLVLLGNASINQSSNQRIEGIDSSITIPSGVNVTYGYQNSTTYNTESSGTLSYVRVEYAGASISDNNELNSFTFGGVGSGTTLNHLQAYKGADDGFEFFGGCVNAKYLISTASDDDMFDFDFGYTGKLQFLVGTIDSTMSYSANPNGIECDNDGNSSALEPYTHPVISNLTVVGTSTGASSYTTLLAGAHFRRNCKFTLVNSILYGFPKGIYFNNANADYIFENNVVWGVTSNFYGFSSSVSSTNSGLTSYSGIVLENPWGAYKSSALTPTAGPAYDGEVYTLSDSFFESTDYKGGAIDANDNTYWINSSWVK